MVEELATPHLKSNPVILQIFVSFNIMSEKIFVISDIFLEMLIQMIPGRGPLKTIKYPNFYSF